MVVVVDVGYFLIGFVFEGQCVGIGLVVVVVDVEEFCVVFVGGDVEGCVVVVLVYEVGFEFVVWCQVVFVVVEFVYVEVVEFVVVLVVGVEEVVIFGKEVDGVVVVGFGVGQLLWFIVVDWYGVDVVDVVFVVMKEDVVFIG